MATRRTTHGKRERERAKQERASAKRERRAERAQAEADEIVIDDGVTAEDLLERMREIHAAYDAGEMSFEDFDTERSELTDRIAEILAR
ncbi:MAG: hypothetical protein ACKOBG_06945 [Actinomycetota bacterium]